jgi:hypothetical protein
MKHDAYYLIRPLPRTLELALHPELKDFLEDQQLWANAQGGKDVWSFADYQSALKGLFVAYVKQAASAKHACDWLRGLQPNEACFDQWWSLSFFDGWDERAADAFARLDPDGLDPELLKRWKALFRA